MAKPNPKEKDKNGFDVESLPVGTRRIIRSAVLVLVMAVIFLVWLPTVKYGISKNSAQGSGELEGVGKDLEKFLDQIKVKMNIDEQALSASESEPNAKAKAEVADLLSGQLTADWQEYADFENRFSLKYPPALNFSTSSEILARLGFSPTTTVMEIKKFATLSSFSNLNNIKKIYERPGFYLVIIDYANNTTTELIYKTFKLLDNNL